MECEQCCERDESQILQSRRGISICLGNLVKIHQENDIAVGSLKKALVLVGRVGLFSIYQHWLEEGKRAVL